MTPEQQAHRERVLAQFTEDFRRKYDKGQREHGGNLWERVELINWAIEEAIDQVAFLYTLREQLQHLIDVPPVPALQAQDIRDGYVPPDEA